MKIYVCGNPLIPEDSTPIKLISALHDVFPEIEFEEFEPTDNLPEKNMVIIDTIINLDHVRLIEDIDLFQTEKRCSLHDFDLGINLKLLKKFGLINNVKIIGIPKNFHEKEFEKLTKIITNLS